jgi:NADH:ubiquinone oxidoreductase subunit E
LIELLQDLQHSHGYLPEVLLREIAGNLKVPLIEVFRIVNFYNAFSMEPKGRHQITICRGTACHVRRSDRLVEELRSLLGIGAGETTEDGQFSVETVNCLGACALGPIVVIDGEYHDHVTPAKLRFLIAALRVESADLEREVG